MPEHSSHSTLSYPGDDAIKVPYPALEPLSEGSDGPATRGTWEKVRKQPPTREAFVALVAETRGNISQMSRPLGRSRRQLLRYIAMYDIDIEGYR